MQHPYQNISKGKRDKSFTYVFIKDKVGIPHMSEVKQRNIVGKMKVTKTNVGDNKTNQKTAMDGWMDGGMMDGRMNGKVEGLGKVED